GAEYREAQRASCELLAEEILAIADDSSGDWTTDSDGNEVVDHENIQRSRLRVDARKWILAKRHPEKFGDRAQVEHSGGLNVQVVTGVPQGGEHATKARCKGAE